MFSDFRNIVTKRRWLDVRTGLGSVSPIPSLTRSGWGGAWHSRRARTLGPMYFKELCHVIFDPCFSGLGIRSSVFWANRSFFCEKNNEWEIRSKKRAICSFAHFWCATWVIRSHLSLKKREWAIWANLIWFDLIWAKWANFQPCVFFIHDSALAACATTAPLSWPLGPRQLRTVMISGK